MAIPRKLQRLFLIFFLLEEYIRSLPLSVGFLMGQDHHPPSCSANVRQESSTSTAVFVTSRMDEQDSMISSNPYQGEGKIRYESGKTGSIDKLWSYVLNLQKARRTGDSKPSKSLVFYLINNPLADVDESLIEPLERALTQALRSAGEAGDYRLVLQLMDASVRYANQFPMLTPRIFGEALYALSQTQANVSKIKQIWSLAINDGIRVLQSPLTAFELNVLLKALASRGKTRACVNLYRRHTSREELKENSTIFIRPDAYTASTIFSILTDSIDVDQVPTKPQRIELSSGAFQLEKTLAKLSASPCWQWNTAIELLHTLREESLWNNHVYSSLLRLQDRAQEVFRSHENGPKIAVAILDSMMHHKLNPDLVTCTVAIKAMGDPSVDRQSWKLAVKFLDQMKSQSKLPNPNAYSYSAAIVACARCGEYNMALELLNEMRTGGKTAVEAGFVPPQPNTWVYNAALLAVSNQEELRNQPGTGRQLSSRRSCPDGKHRQDLALRLLEQMNEDASKRGMDTKPDTVTYNTVLAIIGSARDESIDRYSSSTVMSLIDEMKNEGITRDSITYRNAVFACRDAPGILRILQVGLEDDILVTRSLKDSNRKQAMKPPEGKAIHGLTFVFNAALSVFASRGNLKIFREVFALMQKEKVSTNGETTTHLINVLCNSGKSKMISPMLTALSGNDTAVFARQQLFEMAGLELLDENLPPLGTFHYSSAISACLTVNELVNAHKILAMMRDRNMAPTPECMQNFALAYARLAVTSASKEYKERRENHLETSVSAHRAQSAYSITMALSEPPLGLLSKVSKACATTEQWKNARAILRRFHKSVLDGLRDEALPRPREIDMIQGLHSSLLRSCVTRSNITAALWYVSDIQTFSRHLQLKKGDDSKVGPVPDASFQGEEDFFLSLKEMGSTTGVKVNFGMRAQDWVSLVKTASICGHWRICVNTLHFLRSHVEKTNFNLYPEEHRAVLDSRYEHLAPALTAAVTCLEARSQYAWSLRIIEDWIDWSGRVPRPEAVLSAIRILSSHGRGEEAKALLSRCVQNGPHNCYAKKGVTYEEMLYIGAVTALHNNGLYDDADEAFISGISQGYLPFSFEEEESQYVLDLHGMNVAMAHSAVRVAMRQQVSRSEGQEACNMMIITGRGRNSELRMRPVLRPEVQRMLLEEFYPPLNTISAPGNMGALIVLADGISEWQAHQQEQKGVRMLTLAALLKNLSSDRLRRSIALTLEATPENEESSPEREL